MRIYEAKADDFETIVNIVHTTINTIYPMYYPDDVVKYFLNHHSKENIKKAMNNEKIMLVNDGSGSVVGTGTLYNNEIKRMFILPQYQGNSYGTQLLEKLEQLAIDNGHETVVLSASLPAYGLYKNRGYVPIKYNKIITEKGQVLCYNEMQKTLFSNKELEEVDMKKQPRWYFNEFKQVGVDYTNIKEVEDYDNCMQKLRDIKKESIDIQNALKINSSDLVLEIGTGTGELALGLSDICRKIIAIDVSEKMIDFARSKAEKQRKGNVYFCHAGFLTYENNDESFDAVITQLALHHLTDFWKMVALRRIYGMLKEGGRFYLRDVVFPSNIQNYDNYFTNIISGLNKNAGEKIANETEIHISEEFSTLDWIMEGLLKNVGFRIEEIKSFDGFLTTYICKK